MIIIGDKIVSDDLVEKDFVCNLSACKGNCCVLGDEGPALEEEEVGILDDIYEDVKDFITPEGREAIETNGTHTMNDKGELSAALIEGKACAFVQYDKKGIALCGIELAHKAGKTDFLKPVSCQLYPIRISKYEDFDAVNYERWDICNPACTLGKELQMPVYRFLKAGLVRKYGQDFYEELEAAAQHLQKKS